MPDNLISQNPPAEAPKDTANQGEINWQKAFFYLVAMTCTGFVSSWQVERWTQTIRDEVDPRAADYMVEIFNHTRRNWMQRFMG